MPSTSAAAAQRASRKYQLLRAFVGWLAALILAGLLSVQTPQAPKISLTLSATGESHRRKRLEDFVDFFRQHKIVVADALHAVGGQIDDHFVPHVEPFGMMVHRFRKQCHARHVAKRGHKITARKFSMQFAVDHAPSLHLWQQRCDFRFAEFLCRHGAFLPNRLAFSPAIMRRMRYSSKNRTDCEAGRPNLKGT